MGFPCKMFLDSLLTRGPPRQKKRRRKKWTARKKMFYNTLLKKTEEKKKQQKKFMVLMLLSTLLHYIVVWCAPVLAHTFSLTFFYIKRFHLKHRRLSSKKSWKNKMNCSRPPMQHYIFILIYLNMLCFLSYHTQVK